MLLVFNSNNVYNDLNLILDIILMRAINVKNSERCESIQLLKFLVDTIVQYGRDHVDRLRVLTSYMQNSLERRMLSMSPRRETSFFRIRNNISNAFVCLSVYIKKIYTDVCEWSLRNVARNQFLYIVTKPFTVRISIIYSLCI